MALGNQYIHKFLTKVLDEVISIVVFLNNFCHFKNLKLKKNTSHGILHLLEEFPMLTA